MEEYANEEVHQTQTTQPEHQNEDVAPKSKSQSPLTGLAHLSKQDSAISELPYEHLLEIARFIGNSNMSELMTPNLQIETQAFGGFGKAHRMELTENQIPSMPAALHNPDGLSTREAKYGSADY